jgi:RNase adapter protein RapZ
MRLIIVSGLSGSGKSVALNTLEDLGWYCVDNIPAGLLGAFISHTIRSGNKGYHQIAVGLDARNEAGEILSVPHQVQDLRRSGIACEIIYLHAEESVLLRRYAETRRRHPLARDGADLRAAIAEERRLLEPIIYSADLVIDSSRLSVHALREMIRQRVEQRAASRLSIMFESFGFKDGIPTDADFVLDARTLPNPYWEPALRPLNGRDEEVVAYLQSRPEVEDFYQDIARFIEKRIPLYQQHNRAYLTVAIGCTGGQHRSVYLVERLAKHFGELYPQVMARHTALPG